ncbi:MAG: Mini-ribonuclease 3 [Anaerovoracaceae bacterium]|nr:ribonuclease III domain-containing protein [Bacillota bacterium]
MNPKDINTTALAYIGDAVYEVYVRRHVLENSAGSAGRVSYGAHVDALHKRAIGYVCAAGQAAALKAMVNSGFLSDEEISIAKRARNHKSASKPKNADAMDYKYATAFEALLGYLYLEDREHRLEEIIFEAFEIIETGE